MSDHLIPRIIAAIEAEQLLQSERTIRNCSIENFSLNQGIYFGLERALEILKDTIKSSDRS